MTELIKARSNYIVDEFKGSDYASGINVNSFFYLINEKLVNSYKIGSGITGNKTNWGRGDIIKYRASIVLESETPFPQGDIAELKFGAVELSDSGRVTHDFITKTFNNIELNCKKTTPILIYEGLFEITYNVSMSIDSISENIKNLIDYNFSALSKNKTKFSNIQFIIEGTYLGTINDKEIVYK